MPRLDVRQLETLQPIAARQKVSLQHAGVVFLTDSMHANVERPAVLLVDPDDFLLSLIVEMRMVFSGSSAGEELLGEQL